MGEISSSLTVAFRRKGKSWAPEETPGMCRHREKEEEAAGETPEEANQPCQHLRLRLRASKTVRNFLLLPGLQGCGYAGMNL